MKQLEPVIRMKYIKNDGKQVWNMQKAMEKGKGYPPMFWRNEKEAGGSATLSIYCTHLG